MKKFAYLLIPALLAGCASIDSGSAGQGHIPIVRSEAEVDRLLGRVEQLGRRAAREYRSDGAEAIIVTGSRMVPPNITNVQEAGVDEGGIVKQAGDYLIVLRRGRLFTIRHGNGSLEPVAFADAFPPGTQKPGEAWYDEMLVSGDTVLVVGYSYGGKGTEINRFHLSADGRIRYRDTHYLHSEDYYSARNYSSRLIDGKLVFYTPIDVSREKWREKLPAVRMRLADGTLADPQRTGSVSELAVPRRFVSDPFIGIDTIHSVTVCDAEAPDLACRSRMVLGAFARGHYVTRDAAYVWTGGDRDWTQRHAVPAMLYRIPLDGTHVTGIQASGMPIDQFSFFDDYENLNVVVSADGEGDAMWMSELADADDLALVQIPLDRLGDGSASVPVVRYRPLPEPDGYSVENRFVGSHLLFGASGDDAQQVFVTPLEKGWVGRIRLPHSVSRIDVLGRDAIVIGPTEDDALGFSTILLDEYEGTADLGGTYLLPSAVEGENRSHAFAYRPDVAAPDGKSGIMALPISRDLDGHRLEEVLGRGSALMFLRRSDRELSAAGQVAANHDGARPDGCKASCVDWYGNARPIFLGDRIFALLGYEIVEARLVNGRIEDVRRVDFTPLSADGWEEME